MQTTDYDLQRAGIEYEDKWLIMHNIIFDPVASIFDPERITAIFDPEGIRFRSRRDHSN